MRRMVTLYDRRSLKVRRDDLAALIFKMLTGRSVTYLGVFVATALVVTDQDESPQLRAAVDDKGQPYAEVTTTDGDALVSTSIHEVENL